jgi:urocanate hydratase
LTRSSRCVAKGTYFFDYGNSFLKAVYDAGVKEVSKNGVDDKDGFIFPSYVEDIMGPLLFDYGYGPFRWVCLSGKHEDLIEDRPAAMDCIDPNRRLPGPRQLRLDSRRGERTSSSSARRRASSIRTPRDASASR